MFEYTCPFKFVFTFSEIYVNSSRDQRQQLHLYFLFQSGKPLLNKVYLHLGIQPLFTQWTDSVIMTWMLTGLFAK